MINMETQKEAVSKTAKTVADNTAAYKTKAVELSTDAASTATDKAKELFAATKEFAGAGFDKVTSVKLGDKNVGEHAQATVDSVQSAVDVDQISDQVAKLREQIEGVLGSWKDQFRPTTGAPAPAAKPAAKAVDYKALTVSELRAMAADADIAGRSKMNKGQLITALKKANK